MADPKKALTFEEALADDEPVQAASAPQAAPASGPSSGPISFEDALADEAMPAPAEAAPSPAPEAPERSLWERFQDTIKPGVDAVYSGDVPDFLAETAHDALTSASRGFRMGSAKPDPILGGQKAVELGLQPSEEEQRADWARADERSPIASAIGDAAGTAINPLSRTGSAAVAGGVTGAARAAGEGGDAKDVALATMAGGAFGKAGDMIGGAVQNVAGRLAKGADKAADSLRLRSFGARTGDLKKLSDAKKAELARAAEALGIHHGEGFLPGRVEDVAENAGRVQQNANATKNALAEQVANAPVSTEALAERVGDLKTELGTGPGGMPLRNDLDSSMDEFRAMPERELQAMQPGAQGPAPASIPFDRMNAERQVYGKGTNFAPGTPRAALRPKVYNAINDEMEAAANAADPGVGTGWRAANKNESVGIQTGDWARDQLNREASNRQISPSDYAAGMAGGALLGGGTGAAEGYRRDGAVGAFKGAAGALPGAIAGVIANKAWRGREHAILASTNRAAGKYAVPAANAFAQSARDITRAGAPQLGAAAGKLLTRPPERLSERIASADPALLGSWGERFAEAGDDEARTAAIWHEAMRDENFAREIAPQLERSGAP